MIKAVRRNTKDVEVLDAMCGTGKTFNLFKFISLNPYERFIYVTPMLTEVSSRPAEELAKFGDCGVVFHEPNVEGFRTKGDHLLALLEAGNNIICTHTLFQQMGPAAIELVYRWGYIAIIDEELGMIGPISDRVLAKADARLLIEKGVISTETDGRVLWLDDRAGEGDSAFATAREMADSGGLYINKQGTFFNIQLPVELICAAKRVIIATYLFEGSILHAFLTTKGLGFKPFTFDGLELRNERQLKRALKARIEFKSPPSTERFHRELGVPVDEIAKKDMHGVLSSTWYKNANKSKLKKVENHLRNVARYMGIEAEDLIYTLPSKVVGKDGDRYLPSNKRPIKPKGFPANVCFLHKGARAVNDYSERTAAIHAYNRYIHPAITTYLKDHGAEVSDEAFALAEMIQWLFRTALRIPDGPTVQIHIAAPRMEKLFRDWLEC